MLLARSGQPTSQTETMTTAALSNNLNELDILLQVSDIFYFPGKNIHLFSDIVRRFILLELKD